MQHAGTKTIETDRLLLRRFTQADILPAYRNWTSDAAVTKYLTWLTHPDTETTQSVIENWIGSYEKPDFYLWAIELKTLGEPVGSISAVKIKEDRDIVEIGYCIGKKWWRQGITGEALAAVIPFFFGEVKANRIEAMHDPHNPNSGRVMQKCGLRHEGTLRQASRNNQGIVDAAIYGLLASEYYNGLPQACTPGSNPK